MASVKQLVKRCFFMHPLVIFMPFIQESSDATSAQIAVGV